VGKNGVYKSNAPPIGNSKLHDEDELPENLKGKADEAENLSKSAAKNKKRREAAKKKQHEEANNPANPGDKANSADRDTSATTGDPEKDKKIRKVNDKLSQIAKLKAQVKEGKQLEANQLEKIKKESELLAELKQLRI
jgi:translation initiation factor 2A